MADELRGSGFRSRAGSKSGWLDCCLAADFAAESTASLPSTSACPGIQRTLMTRCGSSLGEDLNGNVGFYGDGLRYITRDLLALHSKCLEELVICAYCTDLGDELNVVAGLKGLLPESVNNY